MYHVFKYDYASPQGLENWLNDQRAEGYELVSFSGNTFVFKREQFEYNTFFGSQIVRQTNPTFIEN